MFTDLELMERHIRALFTHDKGGRILFVNEPTETTTSAPRIFLGRTREGNIWRFRADLPDKLCNELNSLCLNEPFVKAEVNESPRHFESYIQLLEESAPVKEYSTGPAYYFTEKFALSKSLVNVTVKNAEVLEGGFEECIDELETWQPFVAFVLGSKAVSICRSVRITSKAHEAGVETLPGFRRQGYAKEVTAEWARQVQNAGAAALYSTSWENLASQSVARKLKLKFFGTDFNLS